MSEALGLHFTLDEYRNRIAGVQAEMARRGIDVLMVNHLENIYYLSGFRTIGYYSFMALFVPASGEPVHFARLIEQTTLQGTSWIGDRALYPDTENYGDATIRVIKERGWANARIGIDKSAWYLTIDDYERLVAALPNATMVDGSMIVENLRLIKSPAEQAYSRQSGKAASAGMRSAIGALRAGITEDDLMAAAYQGLFEMHSEYPGLPPLINAGVRHTMAHAMAEGHPVNHGDAVYFEVGASIKRYHAATLRIGYVGTPPKLFHDLTDLCRRSIDAGLTQMKPGNPAELVDKAARKVIADAGYGDKFRHKAGYSIGIALPPDWSEARTMMLRGGETRPLRPGMVFHFLPAVFEYKEYGVGLSETLLVTETGYEILTEVEQKLFVVKP
jgi:Xaa-Pro dipeptidase